MNTATRPERGALAKSISFSPLIWERLEAEAAQLERPNRSLIVERALRMYFDASDGDANDQEDAS